MRAEQATDPVAYHGEGPVWSERWGGLRWVDMLAGDVLSLEDNGEIGRRRVGSIAAALRPRSRGGAVIGVERGFALEDSGGALTHLDEAFRHHAARRRKEAVVRFRPVPHLPFDGGAEPAANELRVGLDGPYDFALSLTGMASGPPSHLAPLVLSAELSEPELPAYSRVLMEVLDGNSSLSIRGDEAEQAWRILTPLLRAWADDRVPMQEYPAGSTGPPALDDRGVN